MSPILRTNDAPQPSSLPDLPNAPLSAQQHSEAQKRVEEEAEKRIKLGMQIYRAAEVHTGHQQAIVDTVKQEQQELKEQLQEDVSRSLHAYDQWVGKIDESFTNALRHLEDRVNTLQQQWAQSQQHIDSMMRRSEALLDQSRTMVESASRSLSPRPKPANPPIPGQTDQISVAQAAPPSALPAITNDDDATAPASDATDTDNISVTTDPP